MPPFTSTSWTTIVRRTVAAARQQVVHSKAATRAALLAKRRAFSYARSALCETFPSLSQPTFQRLRPQLAPLPIPTSPLQRAALRVRTSGTRFASSYPRGAAVLARVGLNSTRNFSTSIAANNPGVALIVRGIYGIRDEDITRWGADKWSRNWSPAIRHSHKRRRRCSAQNIPSSIYRQKNVSLNKSRKNQIASSQMDQFFPLISTVSRQEQTEDATTTLSISCIPVEDLLSNSPNQSTSLPAADIGVNQFANLLHGLLAVPLAYSNHQSKNVIPLINRIRALGILDDVGRTAVQMSEDITQGVIHISFPHRSARNVRALLGDVHGENDWYYLKETPALSSAQIREINGMFVGIFSDPVSPDLGVQHNSGTQSDVSSVSSRSRSTILNGIPDVGSGFSTPADMADSMYYPFEIGNSSSDLVFPRIDTVSVDEGFLTPPYMSYSSIVSEEDDELSWPEDHMSSASSLSVGPASWASIEDTEDVWSDAGMSDSSESVVGSRRNVSTDEMRDNSMYGVMMPF